MEASEWSVSLPPSHAHTPLSRCLCMPLCPLVYFQSTDQPLTDRTGPLGSCYRPPWWRDWKALIAALRSRQSRENHTVSVIGSLTWDRGEQWERKNERQVRHLVRVKEGKHKEGKAEREWQRLSKTQTIWERDQRKRKRMSLCLTVNMLFTRGHSSRYQGWHMSLSKAKAYTDWQTRIPSLNTKCQDFIHLTVTQTKDFRCRQLCAFLD